LSGRRNLLERGGPGDELSLGHALAAHRVGGTEHRSDDDAALGGIYPEALEPWAGVPQGVMS